jgi:hypothetical protein
MNEPRAAALSFSSSAGSIFASASYRMRSFQSSLCWLVLGNDLLHHLAQFRLELNR